MKHRRIMIEPNYSLLSSVVPGHVWKQGKFKFDPVAFTLESERLKDKIIDEDVQFDSLNRFTENPACPMTYVVSGNPDDSKAKLFAAHLVGLHLRTKKAGAQVVWQSVNGSFNNPLLKPEYTPTMLVITNLSPVSTQVKLDKVRDIVETYQEVPIVLVVAGEDPLSFAMGRIHLPANGIAYFCEGIVKRKMEIL